MGSVGQKPLLVSFKLTLDRKILHYYQRPALHVPNFGRGLRLTRTKLFPLLAIASVHSCSLVQCATASGRLKSPQQPKPLQRSASFTGSFSRSTVNCYKQPDWQQYPTPPVDQ